MKTWRIRYTDKKSGKECVAPLKSAQETAELLTRSLADSHQCDSHCEHVDGNRVIPILTVNMAGRVTHVINE